MVPESLKESCSIGMFLPVVKASGYDFSDENKNKELQSKLLSSLSNYKGVDLMNFTLEKLLSL